MDTTLITSTLRLSPEVQLAERDLIIPRDLPDEELPGIANRILAVRGFSKWALGAVLHEMVERRPKVVDGRRTGDCDPSWANAYGEAMGLDPKERRAVLAVYAFYPPGTRRQDLSWDHYLEAMIATGDGQPKALQRAQKLLGDAKAGGLSVTAFRKYLRTQQATEQPDQTEIDPAILDANWIFDARRAAAREMDRIDSYDADRARLVLHDLGRLPELIDTLRSKATQTAIAPQ